VAGNPGRTDPSVRGLEQLISGLSAVNPITGQSEKLTYRMADPVTEKLLHMVTAADPNRTPTFTLFGDLNFYFQTTGSATPVEGNGFAWNHGDDQPEIARTFVVIAGPGVSNLGGDAAERLLYRPRRCASDHHAVDRTHRRLLA
jgi:hypothetical protein